MDSRHEPRFETNQPVIITLLGDTELTFAGVVANFSARGLCLAADRPLPAGSAVKVELDDMLLLGEVVYCHREAGNYLIGVALEEALYHTGELAALADRLLGRNTVRANLR